MDYKSMNHGERRKRERALALSCIERGYEIDLLRAIEDGEIIVVTDMIEEDSSVLVQTAVYDKLSALHVAGAYSQIPILSMLSIDLLVPIVQATLSEAHSSTVAASLGFARFVSIRDKNGVTPIHLILAARHRQPSCVRILLDNGVLVCCATDRLQIDTSERSPYVVALKHKHGRCASLMNPSSAGSLVSPSALKFIRELKSKVTILECALREANKEKVECALREANKEEEKPILKGAVYSQPYPDPSDIVFDDTTSKASNIKAHFPLCRSTIKQLVVAKTITKTEVKTSSKPKKSIKFRNFSEGSSRFKGLAHLGNWVVGRAAK
ncbi:LOW QUALITY PROTEIN: hypothetical protein RJ641_007327 [Dillenia turbinata]|uniref:Uncharacterized protein n=1 Tax=Dillenia turbinata TaxID=194707 RepID=A0AAN8Z9N8_9MAGN